LNRSGSRVLNISKQLAWNTKPLPTVLSNGMYDVKMVNASPGEGV
jgi:hypothetical protein